MHLRNDDFQPKLRAAFSFSKGAAESTEEMTPPTAPRSDTFPQRFRWSSGCNWPLGLLQGGRLMFLLQT